jgi:hypothetical protein
MIASLCSRGRPPTPAFDDADFSAEDLAIRAHERNIDAEPDSLRRAFLFYDIASRHPCPAPKAAAILKSAVALLGALEQAQANNEKFALHRAIETLLNGSMQHLSTPFTPERFIVHTTASVALYLKSLNLLPKQGGLPQSVFVPDLVAGAVGLVEFANLCPCVTARLPEVWSAERLHRSSWAAVVAILNKQLADSHADFATVSQRRLAGIYRGWLGAPIADFRDAREVAIVAALAAAPDGFSNVEALLCSPLFARDFGGFTVGKMVLPPSQRFFRYAGGFRMDAEGHVRLLLVPSTSADALFTTEDVAFVMQNGMTGSRLGFSDPPPPSRGLTRLFAVGLLSASDCRFPIARDDAAVPAEVTIARARCRDVFEGPVQTAEGIAACGPSRRNRCLPPRRERTTGDSRRVLFAQS